MARARSPEARALDPASLRSIRVPAARGTGLVSAHDQTLPLRGSRHRLALLLTNDFESCLYTILRRYARRWLVEQSISEQLTFFHFNRLSSSMVIMVDFDLTITILAYNPLRLTARSHCDRLLSKAAAIELAPFVCTVALKNKLDLPALLQAFQAVGPRRIHWLGNRRLVVQGATTS